MQHGLLCACSRTGSEGGLECSTGCSVPVDVQGVGGGELECSTGCLVPVVVQGVRGDSSAARAALCL